MNKKAQETIIGVVLFMIFIVAGFLIFYIFTGNATAPSKEGDIPNLQVINPSDCLNQKDGFGFKSDCTLIIKNLENKPVELSPLFECYKLKQPGQKETINSEKDAIPSGDQRSFTISYDNDGREWSCNIKDFRVTNFN